MPKDLLLTPASFCAPSLRWLPPSPTSNQPFLSFVYTPSLMELLSPACSAGCCCSRSLLFSCVPLRLLFAKPLSDSKTIRAVTTFSFCATIHIPIPSSFSSVAVDRPSFLDRSCGHYVRNRTTRKIGRNQVLASRESMLSAC